jgi:phosphatidylserine/phosphatidylglycerophosphate/cardiolipin synthase-like enzyme
MRRYLQPVILSAALSLLPVPISAKMKAAEPTAEPAPVVITGPVTYYVTPYQAVGAEQHFLQVLRSAKSDIKMNAYGFTDANACQSMCDRADAGVHVSVTMDATEAAGRAQKPLVKQLLQHHIEVLIGKSPVHGQLLHAKLAIIDGETAVFGSWNFSPSASQQFNDLCFTDDPNVAKMFAGYWQQIHDYVAEHPRQKR